MTVERKLQVAAGVLIVSLGAMGSILFWNSHQVQSGITAIESSAQVVKASFKLRVLMDEYLEHGDKRSMRQWLAYDRRLDKVLADEKAFAHVDRTLVEDVTKTYRSVKSLFPQVVQVGAAGQGEYDSQDRKVLKSTLHDMMSLRLEELVNAAGELDKACQLEMLTKQKLAERAIMTMAIGMVVILLANFYLIRRSVVLPLRALVKGADAIGAGRFDYVMESTCDDEVGKLARSFNAMIERLKQSYDSLKDEIRTRQRTQEDLMRSNKDLEQFAYVASHDLQEPLRNVASCMHLFERKYKAKLDAEADQLIRYAVESATRMRTLISDLLAYSRISTRGGAFQPTSGEEVLEQTLTHLRESIEETGAVITHDPLPTVTADYTQMLQVFQNLIANAMKFRSKDLPHVHVSAARDGGKWVFSVRDNGIGIDARHQERIFVIFQRLHGRSQYDGTGMGLAIVKKIVERHGGMIWLESEPGAGATFYFTIPAKEGNT